MTSIRVIASIGFPLSLDINHINIFSDGYKESNERLLYNAFSGTMNNGT